MNKRRIPLVRFLEILVVSICRACLLVRMFFFLRFDFISAGGVHLKILIPSNLAGVVLGKGGESIIRIQEESNIKAHMSKANEFFPGKHSHKLSNLVISLLREFNVVFRFQVQTNVFALYRQPKPVTSRKVYK